MAQQVIQVKVEGMDLLRRKLEAGNLLKPTREIVAAAGKEGLETARKAAKPHPGDKGTLARMIESDTQDGGKTVVVAPQSKIRGIATTIEEGRKPGKRPPYGSIKKWMLSHGIISGARGESKLVAMMRDRIRSQGTAGVFFMKKGAEAAERCMKGDVPKAEGEVRKAWDRGY